MAVALRVANMKKKLAQANHFSFFIFHFSFPGLALNFHLSILAGTTLATPPKVPKVGKIPYRAYLRYSSANSLALLRIHQSIE